MDQARQPRGAASWLTAIRPPIWILLASVPSIVGDPGLRTGYPGTDTSGLGLRTMNVGMLIVCGVADWLVVRWYVRCRMYSSWRRSLWTSVVLCTALNGFIIVNRGYIDVIVVVLFLFASAIGHGVTNEVQALVERTRSRRS